MQGNISFTNYIKPVTAEGTKKILEQMTSCICKIKNNQKIGTGFFCRIPYKNNVKITALITSYQIIDEFYLSQNNQINLLMNDYNELKIINIDPMRKIYSSKDYNTTIIELKDSDNINNYLELDDNLFGYNTKSLFENESIYIIQYLNGVKASVSYGILNELNGTNMKYICYLEIGSNGAPILNLVNNKVIGIAIGKSGNANFNFGSFLKFSIEEFINKYQNNIPLMPNIVNNNFPHMMNNNFQIPNMMMNNNNFLLPNNILNNNNMIQFNNINQELNQVINNVQKKNIYFKTSRGLKSTIVVNYGTTIDTVLKQYCIRCNRTDLIDNPKIAFLINGKKLKFGDKTTVEEYFKNNDPTITVIEVNTDLLGGP